MSEPPFDDPDLDGPTDDLSIPLEQEYDDLGEAQDELSIPVEQDLSGAETNESQILGGDDAGGEDDPADHLPDPREILDDLE